MNNQQDILVLRELASKYAEISAKPVQEERRRLWTAHNSLQPTRVPILLTFGMHNIWCREVFGDSAMECKDPFFREQERNLRQLLFHDTLGDDYILEPWLTLHASLKNKPENLWGVDAVTILPSEERAHHFSYKPVIRTWDQLNQLVIPHHLINERLSAENFERLSEAIGDIIAINFDRSPIFQSFFADISSQMAYLRGLEQMMVDMYDSPHELHQLAAFLRDGVLAAQAEGEQNGDWSLTSQENQQMCYCTELEKPRLNSGPRSRKELWCHISAQEFTLVSPAMHNEFLLQYQIPIAEKFGLVAYGCCENLTNKIELLRKIKNLRVIAITPTANVRRCADQIGQDYVFSWRPNPANMISCGFDEDQIGRLLRQGLDDAKGCRVHIHLKDVETVEGDLTRMPRWVQIARQAAND
jgi:hypothetical protein